jgi:hypothetical protein
VFGDSGDAPGATVTISLLSPGGSQRTVAQTVTDTRGEFVATDLPPGRLRLTAVAGATKARNEIEVQAGDTAHTELELR